MKVTLNRGAATTTVDAEPNESILDSLLRNRVDVSYCCRGGICGLCASALLAGEVAEIGPPVAGFAAARPKDREILICRCRPMTDCVVRQSAGSWTGTTGEARTLAVSIRETLDDRTLYVRLSGASDMDPMRFRAGQNVRLEHANRTPIPPGRFFIASRPGLRHLDFYVPLARGGESLAGLERAATVRVGEPIGSASLREDEMEPIVVVAERAGLASALGILDALSTYQVSRPAYLVMKGRAEGVVERMLTELTDRACLPMIALDGADGNLLPAVEEAVVELHGSTHVPPSRFRAYVKATRASIVEARSALHDFGVRPWNVHVEEVE